MGEHHLIRATLIPEIARLIAGRFGISEDEALDRFYKSATAQNLADEENGLNYCRGCVRDEDPGKTLFDEYVATKPLMDSLLGFTDESIMTCSCGEPGCAGFWHQESSLSEKRVHWLLHYKKEKWDILFERDAYGNAVLAVLRQFMEKPWEDMAFPSGTILAEYPDSTATEGV